MPVFGDFGVWGEAAMLVGVGALAGVEAEAGGVDIDATLSEWTGLFLATSGAGVVWMGWVRGLGCVGCGEVAVFCGGWSGGMSPGIELGRGAEDAPALGMV